MAKKTKEISRFFKHSYIYAIGNIINRIGAFLLLPVYTNYLTIEEYGALELFYGVSAVIFGFLSIGIAHATLRFYFEYDDDTNRNAVVSTNFIAAFVISLIGVALVATWYTELSVLVFGSDLYSMGILIILGTIVFELSSQICLAYVRAIERSLFFVYIAIIKLLVQVSLNVYLVIYADKGVLGILLGNFSAVLLGWIILTVFTISRCGLNFHYKKLVEIMKYSLPFLFGTITYLISTNVDKFSLNHLDTLGAVGIYMLAMKFSMVLEQLIGEPFSRSYGSFRFSIMNSEDAPSIQADITKYLLYGTVFVALGIGLFIDELLMHISKSEFWPASSLVPILMISSLLKIMNYPIQTGILYKKKTKYFFYIGLVAAVVSIVGNLTLIPIIGVYGACLTLVFTDVVSIMLMYNKSQKYFKVSYHFPQMFSAFILAAIFYCISLLVSSDDLLLKLLLKSLLVMFFAACILRTRFFLDTSEKRSINNLLGMQIAG